MRRDSLSGNVSSYLCEKLPFAEEVCVSERALALLTALFTMSILTNLYRRDSLRQLVKIAKGGWQNICELNGRKAKCETKPK